MNRKQITTKEEGTIELIFCNDECQRKFEGMEEHWQRDTANSAKVMKWANHCCAWCGKVLAK